jgi:hypothetical protein
MKSDGCIIRSPSFVLEVELGFGIVTVQQPARDINSKCAVWSAEPPTSPWLLERNLLVTAI